MKKFKLHIILPAVIIIVFCIVIFEQNCSKASQPERAKSTKHSKGEKAQSKPNDTIISKNLLIGKVNCLTDTNFTEIAIPYGNRKGQYMQKEAYESFKRMCDAAQKSGVTITIISGFRSYQQQKTIWENKWSGKVKVNGNNLSVTLPKSSDRSRYILKYSSMPGTSRHHWGTDVDLNSLTLVYYQSPAGIKMYDWMCKNAATYGFCQPYTLIGKGRDTGYEEEKWHWSYIPIAKKYLAAYKKQISYDDITGFLGAENAKELDVIERYVLSVNKECQ